MRLVLILSLLFQWSCQSEGIKTSSTVKTVRSIDTQATDVVEQIEPEEKSDDFSYSEVCGALKANLELQSQPVLLRTLCPDNLELRDYHLNNPYDGIGEPFLEFVSDLDLGNEYSEYASFNGIILDESPVEVSSQLQERFLTSTQTDGDEYTYKTKYDQIVKSADQSTSYYKVNTKLKINGVLQGESKLNGNLKRIPLTGGMYGLLEDWQPAEQGYLQEYMSSSRLAIVIPLKEKSLVVQAIHIVARNLGNHRLMVGLSKEVKIHRIKTEYFSDLNGVLP